MPNALVTGASTGIGRDLAFECARAGYDIIAIARNQAQLDEIASAIKTETGRMVQVVAKDLTDAATPRQLFQELADMPVEILINNAGMGLRGLFHDLTLEAQMSMLHLNVNALTAITRLFLPGMIEQGKGRVLNVASTAAFQPGPLMAVYYASKAYVLSLSEALYNEVQDRGVTVTALCPGPTATEFGTRAEMHGTKLFESGNVMSSAEVARIGFQGMMAGDPVIIPGLRNRLMAFATRFAPRQMTASIARRMQEKPD